MRFIRNKIYVIQVYKIYRSYYILYRIVKEIKFENVIHRKNCLFYENRTIFDS